MELYLQERLLSSQKLNSRHVRKNMRKTRTHSDKKQSATLENIIAYRSRSKDTAARIKQIYRNNKPAEHFAPTIVGIRISTQPNLVPSPHKNGHNLKIKIPIKSKTPNSKSPACLSRRQHEKMNSPEVLTARPVPKLQELRRKNTDPKLNFKALGTQKYFRKEREKTKKIENNSLNETLRMIWDIKPKKASKSQFKMIRTLGKSHAGEIIQAVSNNTGIVAAIKTFRKSQAKLDFLIDELKINLFCQHPNILPAYGYHLGKEEVYLVMEVGECNLYDKVVRYAPFDESIVANYIAQIAAGVAYLHELGVMHRDIKPQNIIIIGDVLKIADFGWSIRTNKPRKTLCGTLDYLSPEVSKRQYYNNKIDCWSIGVLMYELLTGQPPFPDQKEEHCQFESLKYPRKLSLLGRDLLQSLLQINPIDRISAREIIEHRWIKKYRNKKEDQQRQRFRELQREFNLIFQ